MCSSVVSKGSFLIAYVCCFQVYMYKNLLIDSSVIKYIFWCFCSKEGLFWTDTDHSYWYRNCFTWLGQLVMKTLISFGSISVYTSWDIHLVEKRVEVWSCISRLMEFWDSDSFNGKEKMQELKWSCSWVGVSSEKNPGIQAEIKVLVLGV